jgi:NAD(P)-dependent dehydrogenase (short-subunit alcohol dehydrogenase family)
VIGATSGIGRELAKILAENNYLVGAQTVRKPAPASAALLAFLTGSFIELAEMLPAADVFRYSGAV